MSSFLYYLPAVATQAALPQAIKERGLTYASETSRPQTRECHRGPDGHAGFVVTAGESEQLGYYPDKQTWRRIPGTDPAAGAWLGWKSDAKPAPEDLLRKTPLDGHAVTLADERSWLAPIARAWLDDDEPTFRVALPQRSVLKDDGSWDVGSVLPRYERLWSVAQAFWDRWNGAVDSAAEGAGEEAENVQAILTFDGLHEAAITALQANYRIGPAECDSLGILTELHCVSILQALIDWPAIQKWLKKKAASETPASSSSPAGPAATLAATGPASPTSGP
jgi:hypothetical protein